MVRFRWITRLGVIVGMVASLIAVPSAGGANTLNPATEQSTQSVPGTFVSAITVLAPITNVGPTDISITFYDPSGAPAGSVSTTPTSNPPSPAPGGTAFWYVPNIPGLLPGVYSAVVSATQQVYATVNLGSTNPITGETYNGVGVSTATTVAQVPSVFQNYHGFTSTIVIQNASTLPQPVSVHFIGSNSLGAVNYITPAISLPGNASSTVDLATLATFLGDSFNGAATVTGTGTQTVAVIANVYTPVITPSTPSYLFSSANAFGSGQAATTSFVPGLYQNYHGFISALHVFNADSLPNDFVVTYSNGAIESVAGLAPGASHLFYIPNNPNLPNGWLGSATVRSSNGKLLLTTVDIQATGVAGVGLASYDGSGSAGTSKVFAPGLLKNYHGFNSALTIQNVDAVVAPAGSIVVTYSDGHTTSNPALAPGANWQLYTPNEALLADGFNGGATVTSTTAKIVGLVSISGSPLDDQLFSTNAFGSN